MPFDVERAGFDASDFEEFKFCFSSQLPLVMKVTPLEGAGDDSRRGRGGGREVYTGQGERKIHIGHTS